MWDVPYVTYTILEFGYCNVGITEACLNLLKDMEHKCLFFNVGYNAIIHEFCCEGDLIGGRRILGDMGWEGLVHNIYSYKSVTDGYYTICDLTNAFILLNEMLL